jgi:hypothetical protein
VAPPLAVGENSLGGDIAVATAGLDPRIGCVAIDEHVPAEGARRFGAALADVYGDAAASRRRVTLHPDIGHDAAAGRAGTTTSSTPSRGGSSAEAPHPERIERREPRRQSLTLDTAHLTDAYANRSSGTTRAIASKSRSSCSNGRSCSIAMRAMRQSIVLRTVTPAARHAP